MREVEQKEIRGDGKLRIIPVEADCLAEATHEAIIACHDKGFRVETPKQKKGMTLGYDADIDIIVKNPDSEPKVYFPGMHDDGRGEMQYILEVTHGIHNHWKKNKEHPEWWGYTYNERFADQLPFVLARIKHDWQEKGRITGRDYNFGIWRASEDVILEQEDSPCFQRGQFRFIENSEGEIVMNYITDWRSRDLLKAWNSNNIGQIELMKLFRAKVSQMLETPIKLGAYVDHSSSLHLYGLYIDRDNLEQQIMQMKKDGYKAKSTTLEDCFGMPNGKTAEQLKRLIYAQSIAEQMGHGLNQPEETLANMGIDVNKFPYPAEWDTWPKSWDSVPEEGVLSGVALR